MDIDFAALGGVGEQFATLHNQGTIDAIQYFETLKGADLTPQERTRISYVLASFSGAVSDTVDRIYSFFHMQCDPLSDYMHHQLENGFNRWAAANIRQLGKLAALINSGPHDILFLGALIFAWRTDAPADALTSALSFSGDKRQRIQRQAIHSLGGFADLSQQEEATVETRLTDLVSSNEPDVQCAAINAIVKRLDKQSNKSRLLVTTLDAASAGPSKEVRHALIAGLAHHQTAYPEPLRAKVTDLIKGVQTDSRGTLELADLALYSMDTDKDHETIFNTLTALLSQESGAPILEDLKLTSRKIEEATHDVVGGYTVSWLLDGSDAVCNQLSTLFPPLSSDAYDFDLVPFGLRDAEILYLTHKVFAYLMFSHGPAVSLLCACLMASKFEQRKELEEEIASFWLRNYPGDLEIFVAVSNEYPRKGLKASIKRLRQQVAAYETPLKALAANPALHPSTMERRIQAEIHHEKSTQISRAVEKKSLLSSLNFHKSVLLYGRASVTYIYSTGVDEPIRQVIPMQSFQTSSALPRMNILYPTRLQYHLFQFRMERRPE